MNDDRTTAATTSDSAGETLQRADELSARTRHAGRWYARYMTVFGVGFGLMTLLLGLSPQDDATAVWWTLGLIAVWAVFVLVMVVWAARRPVQGALEGRTYVPGWVGTGLLYAAALFLGLGLGVPVWAWVLAALVVPLPLLVSAGRVHRSLA